MATDRFPHLAPGDLVPGFEAESVQGGEPIRIDYPLGGGRTFLFVLAPSCGVCMATLPFWNQIASKVAASDRVYGFSVDVGNSYHFQNEQRLVEEGELLFPLLRFVDPATAARYKIANVPHTLVIGPGGRVETALVGELSGSLVQTLLSRPEPAPEEEGP